MGLKGYRLWVMGQLVDSKRAESPTVGDSVYSWRGSMAKMFPSRRVGAFPKYCQQDD
jgi:hypothetical protein